MNFFKKAFTLAEVLITLLIIGVVASLVIPSLINDTQRQEDYSKLLKAVSVIQSTANLIRVENGGRMADVAVNSTILMNLFAEKMSYQRRCLNSTDSPNCYLNNSDDMYNLHGGFIADSTPYPYSWAPKLVSNDGFVYMFQQISSACQDTHYIVNGQPQTCGVVFVDINGSKLPNTWGKDIFLIFINDHNAVVSGNDYGNRATWACDITKTTDEWNGVTCAGRAIIEGGIKYY